MNFRKIVATITIAAMALLAPAVIPARAVAVGPCGLPLTGWLPLDSALAVPLPVPCPTHTSTPWPVIGIALGTVSVIVNSIIIANTQCRQLTQQEAFASIFLPFIGMAMNGHHNHCHPH